VRETGALHGRKPIDVMVMFRMLVLQSLYNLSAASSVVAR
jgi:hypothetical protein